MGVAGRSRSQKVNVTYKIKMSAAPQLRGLLKSQLKKDFAIACVLTFSAVWGVKHFVKDRRAKVYEEFYKNFDAQKEFIRMREAGIFDSVAPGGEIREDGW